jgi:hypothetical protein
MQVKAKCVWVGDIEGRQRFTVGKVYEAEIISGSAIFISKNDLNTKTQIKYPDSCWARFEIVRSGNQLEEKKANKNSVWDALVSSAQR